MSAKILFVDDEQSVLDGYQRSLRKRFAIDTALGGDIALATIAAQGPFAVIIADMQMPGMNGVQLLARVEAQSPDTVRIMLTGNADQKTAADAVNHGHIFRFINKPCPAEAMTEAIEAALKQHYLTIAERELLEQTLNGAVKILTDVLSTVDPRAFGRARQLQEQTRALLEFLPATNAWELELAAMLSSIGRVTLPPTVLQKQLSGLDLAPAESDMLVRVPEVGAELLEQIPRLQNVAQIVRFQCKDFGDSDVSSASLGGDRLPLGARMLKVLRDLSEAEAQGKSKRVALRQMTDQTNRYDPRVVQAACRCFGVTDTADEANPPGATETIRIPDLQPGQTLASDVTTSEGAVVVVAGVVLSSMLVERLCNFVSLGTIPENVQVVVPPPESRSVAA